MNGEELLDDYNSINGYEPEIGECFDIQGNIIETINISDLHICKKMFL